MNPHTVTIAEACRRYGCGKTTLYSLIGSGKVDAIKLGTRTLVITESVERHLASLPRLGLAASKEPR